MKSGKRVFERIISLSLCAVLIAMMVFSLPVTANAKNGDTGSADLHVEYHTKAEIAHYINEHPVGNAYNNVYSSLPSTSSPYALGQVADSTLNDSCTLLNNCRYIAGIPVNVTLSSNYNELAQAASVVNAANSCMSHYPSQPAGMDNAMYDKGYEGASHSNIAYGMSTGDVNSMFNLGYFITSAWMSDWHDGNLETLGHRRWALNPSMAQNGFGMAQNGYYLHSAMYALDRTNSSANDAYRAVAWPAQNTPINYFASHDPWSLSMGDEVEKAPVKLTCTETGQSWTFSGNADCQTKNSTGYFNINNDSYGQKGCIIFRPEGGTNVNKDYSYDVSVSGTISIMDWVAHQSGPYSYTYLYEQVDSKPFTVNYHVDFFDINDYKDQPIQKPLTDEQKAQITAFVKRFYKEVLGRSQADIDADTAGINNWTNALVSGSQSGAEVAYGFVNSTEFKNRDLNNDQFVRTMYKSFFNREPDDTGYANWYTSLQNGSKTRLQVFEGFVKSGEFKTLCANYGIDPGTYTAPPKPQDPALKPLNVDTTGVDEGQLDAFVERLYDKALERPSDAGGKGYWKGCILNGKDDQGREYDIRTVISKGFLNSQEYKNRDRNNAQFVLDCYAAFFDRNPVGTPDEPNYWNWVQQLNNGLSRQQMIENGFGNSQEFKNLIQSYGFVIK